MTPELLACRQQGSAGTGRPVAALLSAGWLDPGPVVPPPSVSQLTADLSFTVNLEGMVPTPGAQPWKRCSSPSVTLGVSD